MLPSTTGSTTFPATRTTKSCPRVSSNTISGGTLESEQERMIAYGFCPCTSFSLSSVFATPHREQGRIRRLLQSQPQPKPSRQHRSPCPLRAFLSFLVLLDSSFINDVTQRSLSTMGEDGNHVPDTTRGRTACQFLLHHGFHDKLGDATSIEVSQALFNRLWDIRL